MTLPRPCLERLADGKHCGELSLATYCPTHARARKRVRNADRAIARAVVAASPVCARCGAAEDLTADHVVPLARGGTNDGERQVLCRPCNSSKGSR